MRAQRRRAFKLFQLGIASAAEVRLLAGFIGKLEHLVNKCEGAIASFPTIHMTLKI